MKKPGAGNKKKKEIRKKSGRQHTPAKPEEPETDTPFDFGGLPNRDLKKNLGCG
ncbi:MAG: hypothetical protein KF845_02645 [Cyclobacteriaceae bacterium]|nr:hypothetical protein [Cyclobacteriaceae bacterium]